MGVVPPAPHGCAATARAGIARATVPITVLTSVLTSVLGVVLAVGPVQGGWAGWTTSAQRVSAPVSRAVVGHTFTPRGAGTGGSTYSTGSALNLVGGVALVDLVSTSTVPVTVTGTVTVTNLLLATRVTLTACTTPWSGSTCPTTSRTVLDDVTISSARPVTWSPTPLTAASSVYLRMVISGSLSNSVVLSAVPVPARAPGDRSTT